ncbi:MAG: FAD-dependent oxidoreductase [Coriobacteriaceae bacterium]|jgi:electron transfer flavoprotein-quinone oxidoreductase|nr:FAD-dependent oxidoreductase [Coriobacteriaceae bacterium]
MVDFDVIIVGAGPAGSVAASVLAKEGKSVLVIERGAYAGAKNMTGGRLYSHALKKLFPQFEEEAPLERKITHEKISLISAQGNTTLDFTSPALGIAGQDSYSVLRAPFDQWLASQAEAAGAEYIYGIAVESLIIEDGRVCGVCAGDDMIRAHVTILADGVNSLLAASAGLGAKLSPHRMAVGVKEVIELPEQVIEDRFLCEPQEGCAWLFVGDATKGHVGGGFLYTNRGSLSLGIVATLSDLCKSRVPIYQMLEDFKNHPAMRPVLKNGKTVEYSGHLIPEGGYRMVPTLYGNGCMVAGDAAMLCMNLGYQVRGMDLAIASGECSAHAAREALETGRYDKEALSSYEGRLRESFVLRDMQASADFPDFMESTSRLFKGYPEMCQAIFQSLFVVDGKPGRPLGKKLLSPVKELGLMNVLKDARKGVKAL